MASNIKITALTNIGANIAYTTLVPVVNMAGTPETQKANLQIVGNLILSGAGGSYFAPAAEALVSQTVSNASQPNITSVGNLANLTVTGNVSLGSNNFFVTSNTISLNDDIVVAGNITLNDTLIGTSNVFVKANTAVWQFGEGGALYWPAPGANTWAIEPNPSNEFEIKSTSNVVISTDISNSNAHFTFASDGVIYAPANAVFEGTTVFIGPNAQAAASGLSNPTVVISSSSNTYTQAVLINQDTLGSGDWVAQGAGGTDTEGYADFGFNSNAFSDANYSIMGGGDGYLYVQTYSSGTGGNLILATGDNGSTQDIIFATGGLTSADEFGRISHSNNAFEVNRANASVIAPFVKTTPIAFASLPSAVTVGAGTRAFITDCNTTTFYAAAAGGGANNVPVFSDGTSWLVG